MYMEVMWYPHQIFLSGLGGSESEYPDPRNPNPEQPPYFSAAPPQSASKLGATRACARTQRIENLKPSPWKKRPLARSASRCRKYSTRLPKDKKGSASHIGQPVYYCAWPDRPTDRQPAKKNVSGHVGRLVQLLHRAVPALHPGVPPHRLLGRRLQRRNRRPRALAAMPLTPSSHAAAAAGTTPSTPSRSLSKRLSNMSAELVSKFEMLTSKGAAGAALLSPSGSACKLNGDGLVKRMAEESSSSGYLLSASGSLAKVNNLLQFVDAKGAAKGGKDCGKMNGVVVGGGGGDEEGGSGKGALSSSGSFSKFGGATFSKFSSSLRSKKDCGKDKASSARCNNGFDSGEDAKGRKASLKDRPEAVKCNGDVAENDLKKLCKVSTNGSDAVGEVTDSKAGDVDGKEGKLLENGIVEIADNASTINEDKTKTANAKGTKLLKNGASESAKSTTTSKVTEHKIKTVEVKGTKLLLTNGDSTCAKSTDKITKVAEDKTKLGDAKETKLLENGNCASSTTKSETISKITEEKLKSGKAKDTKLLENGTSTELPSTNGNAISKIPENKNNNADIKSTKLPIKETPPPSKVVDDKKCDLKQEKLLENGVSVTSTAVSSSATASEEKNGTATDAIKPVQNGTVKKTVTKKVVKKVAKSAENKNVQLPSATATKVNGDDNGAPKQNGNVENLLAPSELNCDVTSSKVSSTDSNLLAKDATVQNEVSPEHISKCKSDKVPGCTTSAKLADSKLSNTESIPKKETVLSPSSSSVKLNGDILSKFEKLSTTKSASSLIKCKEMKPSPAATVTNKIATSTTENRTENKIVSSTTAGAGKTDQTEVVHKLVAATIGGTESAAKNVPEEPHGNILSTAASSSGTSTICTEIGEDASKINSTIDRKTTISTVESKLVGEATKTTQIETAESVKNEIKLNHTEALSKVTNASAAIDTKKQTVEDVSKSRQQENISSTAAASSSATNITSPNLNGDAAVPSSKTATAKRVLKKKALAPGIPTAPKSLLVNSMVSSLSAKFGGGETVDNGATLRPKIGAAKTAGAPLKFDGEEVVVPAPKKVKKLVRRSSKAKAPAPPDAAKGDEKREETVEKTEGKCEINGVINAGSDQSVKETSSTCAASAETLVAAKNTPRHVPACVEPINDASVIKNNTDVVQESGSVSSETNAVGTLPVVINKQQGASTVKRLDEDVIKKDAMPTSAIATARVELGSVNANGTMNGSKEPALVSEKLNKDTVGGNIMQTSSAAELVILERNSANLSASGIKENIVKSAQIGEVTVCEQLAKTEGNPLNAFASEGSKTTLNSAELQQNHGTTNVKVDAALISTKNEDVSKSKSFASTISKQSASKSERLEENNASQICSKSIQMEDIESNEDELENALEEKSNRIVKSLLATSKELAAQLSLLNEDTKKELSEISSKYLNNGSNFEHGLREPPLTSARLREKIGSLKETPNNIPRQTAPLSLPTISADLPTSCRIKPIATRPLSCLDLGLSAETTHYLNSLPSTSKYPCYNTPSLQLNSLSLPSTSYARQISPKRTPNEPSSSSLTYRSIAEETLRKSSTRFTSPSLSPASSLSELTPTNSPRCLSPVSPSNSSRLPPIPNRQVRRTPIRRSLTADFDSCGGSSRSSPRPVLFHQRPLRSLAVISPTARSILSRSPSPCNSLSSGPVPRRIFPQQSAGAADLDDLRTREQSPVVFDANLTFVLGTKSKMKHNFKALPAHMELDTASNLLSNKIEDFLKRTDHVMDEWKGMGHKDEDEDFQLKRTSRRPLGRSSSAANIMIKGFQYFSRGNSAGSRSSMARELYWEDGSGSGSRCGSSLSRDFSDDGCRSSISRGMSEDRATLSDFAEVLFAEVFLYASVLFSSECLKIFLSAVVLIVVTSKFFATVPFFGSNIF